MQTVTYVLGASGSGKSTRARAHVAALEAAGQPTLLVATDVVRAQLRAVLDRGEHPDLWAESFDVPMLPGDAGAARAASDGGLVNVAGFLRQCVPIVASVVAAIDYALDEGWSCVVEGVHLVPGTFAPVDPSRAQVRIELCAPRSPDVHGAMFSARDAASGGGRPAAHYHANLPRIEVIAGVLAASWQHWSLDERIEREVVATGD